MQFFKKILAFYIDGFRSMTYGKELWLLVFLKAFILFAVLRFFFFQPALKGKTDEEKGEFVGKVLTEQTAPNSAWDKSIKQDTTFKVN